MLTTASSDASKVFAVELRTGRSRWEADVRGISWTTPAVTLDRVYAAVRHSPSIAPHEGSLLALDRETDETIEAEITGLVEQYQRLGLSVLTDVIIGRSVRGEQGLYLLANADRRLIAGNLDAWPETRTARLSGFRRRPLHFGHGLLTM